MSEAVRVKYGIREGEKTLIAKGDALVMVNGDGSLAIEVQYGAMGIRLRLDKDEAKHHAHKLVAWARDSA